jgi:hypothetical protein
VMTWGWSRLGARPTPSSPWAPSWAAL